MQYIDLQPFEDFVRSRNLVDERHLPFYLKWVLRFLRSEFDRERLSSSDLLQCFSDQLARDERLEDWQRRQAVKAAELYLNIYLPEANGMAHGVEGMGSGGERSEDGGQNVDAVSSPRFLNIGNSGKAGATPAVLNEAGATPAVQNDEQQALREMKELMKLRHYSPRTLQTYTEWAQRYFGYAKGHKLAWDAPESIRVWLSSLATQRNVASSTQNQAFSAILFLFRDVLKINLPEVNAVRAKRGPKLPVVLTPEEVQKVLSCAKGTIGLMLRLSYGAGLRVSELIRLRVQDLDFGNETLFVRSGKGDKDRATTLPASLTDELHEHLKRVRALHDADLEKGFGAVWLPGALARKYPNAPTEWKWQYVFPAKPLSVDPESGTTRRHHVSEQVVQRALKKAADAADIPKRVSIHTLRHSFATHLLMQGVNIREVQELLGHKSVETTMIYTHVVRTMSARPKSPLDTL
jgi:integron integrase